MDLKEHNAKDDIFGPAIYFSLFLVLLERKASLKSYFEGL